MSVYVGRSWYLPTFLSKAIGFFDGLKSGIKCLIIFVEGVNEYEQFTLNGDRSLHFYFGSVKYPKVDIFQFRDILNGDQSRKMQCFPNPVIAFF